MIHEANQAMRTQQKAFSIIEVMIGLSILGVIGAAVVTLVGNKLHQHRLNALKIAKDRIVRQLEEGLSSCENLQDSYTYFKMNNPRNKEMDDCMNAAVGATPVFCKPQYMSIDRANPGPNEFSLYARSNSAIQNAGTDNVIKLSGYWSKDGEPNCNEQLMRCPFFVQTYFYFSCPLDRAAPNATLATLCTSPSRINLFFTIEQTNKQANPLEKGFNFKYPLPDGKITAASTPISLSVDTCRNTPQQSCPPDMFISGYDQSGAVVCACYSNRPERDQNREIKYQMINGRKTNIPEKCLNNDCIIPGQVIVGYNKNVQTGDWEPDCRVPNSTRQCSDRAVCKPREYLAQADVAKCQPTLETSGKKSSPKIRFVCPPAEFKCCPMDHF
ncbi:MAG: type II secretion system protein [Deltaproteobacteria bacterium]|nr:type II secretion system protein [Deltaproteobacteria bacterium]